MIFRSSLVACAALAIALVLGAATAGAATTSGGQVWLAASDVHFNPYDQTTQPRSFGSDTNAALLNLVLDRMKRAVPDPAVVLLPGDFFVHDFTKLSSRGHAPASASMDAGIRTMRRLARAFGRRFPNAQFAIVMGNNDAPCGDYRSDVNDAYLAATARIWAPLVDRHGAAPDFERTFARAGYYTAALPVRGLRLVALNTVLFSKVYRGSCSGDASNAAANELAWLRSVLGSTPDNMRNVVMMHIPPGWDALSTQTTHGFIPWPFLNGGDNQALVELLSSPQDRVVYAIAGHTHRFDFRLVGNVPLIVLGSVSPVYHNNPAFYALHVAGDGSLLDIDAYAFDEWTQAWLDPHGFDRLWGVDRIAAPALANLHARLGGDSKMRRSWDLSSSGWPVYPRRMWPMWDDFWRVPWCAQTILNDDGFASCAGIERRADFTRVAAVVALLLVLGVAYAIARRVLRRKAR